MIRGKMNKQGILCFFMYTFLLINLFRDRMPGGINQLLGGFIVVYVILNLLPLTKKELFVFVFYVFSMGIALFTTDDIATHVKYSICFILNISVFFFLKKYKHREKFYNYIVKRKRFLRASVLLFTIMIGVMLVLNQCYSTDLWNGGRYFQGFSVPHGVAGSCCLAITTIALLLSIDKKYRYIYLISIFVFLVAIVKAGTRTYLISAAAMLLLVCLSLVKNEKLRKVVVFVGAIAFILVIVNSESFQKKIEYSMNFQNLLGWSFLDAFTSSRTIIWSNDIKFFFEKSNIMQVLFGGGFAYSYEINSAWTYRIQAHNGFIEVFMSTGVIGLALYLRTLIVYLKSVTMKNKWFFLTLLLYVPTVIFWDDILQAPSYMMSFIMVFCEMNYLIKQKHRSQGTSMLNEEEHG